MTHMTDWIDLADFIFMGGYGLYVWGSLGMCAATLGAEVLALRMRRRALSREMEMTHADTQAQGHAQGHGQAGAQ